MTTKIATKTVSQIRKHLEENCPNLQVRVWKGNLVAKRTYFYTHGNTATKFAEYAKGQIEKECGVKVEIVSAEDHWNAWPKESYFRAEFKVVE